MPNITPKDTGEDLTPAQIKQRNDLIVKYLPLIESTALKYYKEGDGHYSRSDLVSVAYEAATVSATKHIRNGEYDDKTFQTYLTKGIWQGITKFKEREAETFMPLDSVEDDTWDIDHNTPETKVLEEEAEQHKRDVAGKLMDLCQHLRPRQASFIYMHFIRGMTQAQIASELEISPQSVSTTLNRAIVALKQQAERNGVEL